MTNIYIALENIRSLYNVGAIFRTASFFGIYNIFLIGYSGMDLTVTGKPKLHEKLAKSALGSEKDLNTKTFESTTAFIEYCRKQKINLFSIEQCSTSEPLQSLSALENDTAIVFGNEVEGVSEEMLSNSNKIFEITKFGKHNSLNVTTACGIVLYQITKILK
ncbi:TrmH family RNA methyltransferase [Candidatus Nomurabacteria bacterium]|uniref:TrmH family RNA methyltransferase n=1 Tax=candidate division WWE3 bacterium TaxID=2053526 RepID=A0A955E2N0_UNCKA|nr:TrmH family RNA methyltransferase [candidate division WWE3 bacterium]MCB9823436.1 TrmH family RNA methyltransferase [Candidatus Nomurabacteria bacterium]MCB9827718.1 TrmH family RNA methyltransferase [Candidatus Nomurabacteria bacterium]HXK52664.1 TrmH family RNA methyltransferase [bacterium]